MSLGDILALSAILLCSGFIAGAVAVLAVRRKHKPSATDLIHAWRAECAQHEKGSVH